MQALILAAGRGSRLGALTKNKPKCLYEFAGKTLLQWQIDALKPSDHFSITSGSVFNLDLRLT